MATSHLFYFQKNMLRLEPLAPDDFRDYMTRSTQQYAEDIVQSSGCSYSVAYAKGEDSVHQLLPHGMATEGQYILRIISETEGGPVGIVWYGIDDSVAFIYDFEIYSKFRGQGYAKQALELLENIARELKLSRLELNVFAHNVVARTLYERAGFQPAEITMLKKIV
ncbi:GNAT family N-acetyltransferase [Collimonas humicola]|uniref:GNAT family N-acetyltransferase n=2 Tax=Collimonas humicola TaxID=2825886 RepID=UPI001B8C28B4|nr:GNAT family N-acetyltransferase [Collimonas humicola]